MNESESMAGIYIHIPFCKQKCSYCDFFSVANMKQRDRVVHAIAKELFLRKDYLATKQIDTIYFGGGTPSLLNEADFSVLFHALQQSFDLSSAQEVTLEANPDDLCESYVQMLRNFPFNRLSIGLQTSNDNTLNLFKRRGCFRNSLDAIRIAKEAGYDNISLDLIYGWPGETIDDLNKDLNALIDLRPQHVSAYHLSYEENTSLYNKVKRGVLCPIDESMSVTMYHSIVEQLNEAGIQQYEISNFALPGYESKHNSSYWRSVPYLGVGPSAHSFNLTSRSWNPRDISSYVESMENNTTCISTEVLTPNEQYNDFVMTRLRTIRGIDLEELEKIHGKTLSDYCLSAAVPYLKRTVVIIENGCLRLTQEGVFVSDSIISDLLAVD